MVQNRLENDSLICTFKGRQDTITCSEWQPEYKELLLGFKGKVVFDIAEVDYISSLFLRICLETAKNLHVQSLRIQDPTPEVRKMFEIAGFDRIMEIDQSV